MASKPNIFEWATSELSQDAFICWLVSWVTCDEDPLMQNCAKDFVALLYNLGREEPVESSAIEAVEKPLRQYCHTDVYFQATVASKRISFIVEDKTHTTHHSGQLERYLEAIRDDKIEENEVVPIYFKSGFLYPCDREAEDHGYRILDYKNMQAFLDKHKTDDDIFESYRTYFDATFYKPYETWFDLFRTGKNIDLIGHQHVQWQFMEALQGELAKLGELASIGLQVADTPSLYNGQDVGGRSWTELKFVLRPGVYGAVDESVFYRVSWRKGGHYLIIRQHAFIKKEPKHRAEKLRRLSMYRDCFEPLRAPSNRHQLEFGKPVTDNKGKQGSEIAVLFFDGERNTPQRVIDQIPRIHAEFVRRIKQSDLLACPSAGSAGR